MAVRFEVVQLRTPILAFVPLLPVIFLGFVSALVMIAPLLAGMLVKH